MSKPNLSVLQSIKEVAFIKHHQTLGFNLEKRMQQSKQLAYLLITYLWMISTPSQAEILNLSQLQTLQMTQQCPTDDLVLSLKPAHSSPELQLHIPAQLKSNKNDEYSQETLLKITRGKQPVQSLTYHSELPPESKLQLCLLRIEDFNFDGYLDLALPRLVGAKAIAYQFWLYQPLKQRFATTSLSQALTDLVATEFKFNQQTQQIELSRLSIEKTEQETYQLRSGQLSKVN